MAFTLHYPDPILSFGFVLHQQRGAVVTPLVGTPLFLVRLYWVGHGQMLSPGLLTHWLI